VPPREALAEAEEEVERPWEAEPQPELAVEALQLAQQVQAQEEAVGALPREPVQVWVAAEEAGAVAAEPWEEP
jgi:hypothetical protein